MNSFFCRQHPGQRESHADHGSLAGVASNVDRSVPRQDALTHAQQPKGMGTGCCVVGNAASVILHLEMQRSPHSRQADGEAGGGSMPSDIGEDFLQDAEQGQRSLGGKRCRLLLSIDTRRI